MEVIRLANSFDASDAFELRRSASREKLGARARGPVTEARVELVWDPPWDQERMSEDARLALGLI